MLLAVEHPAQRLHQEAVVLLSAKNLDAFLMHVRTNASLRLLVKGILVDPSGKIFCLTCMRQNSMLVPRCQSLSLMFHPCMTIDANSCFVCKAVSAAAEKRKTSFVESL